MGSTNLMQFGRRFTSNSLQFRWDSIRPPPPPRESTASISLSRGGSGNHFIRTHTNIYLTQF